MKYFITGTGTDVGKTYVASLLKKQHGWKVLKPVSSGSNDDEVLGTQPLYKLKAALSPNHAAKAENIELEFSRIVDFCKNSDAEIIEGAGGVMSPLTNTHTNLDLINELKVPVILVAGNYLGTISHTLTALKALEGHVVQVVLNEYAKAESDAADIADDIKYFSGHDVIILRHGQQDCDIA